MLRKYAYLWIIAVLLVSLLGGCSLFGAQSSESPNPTAKAPPRGTTGTISTTAIVESSPIPVTPQGGSFKLNDPASPLNGMVLGVPPGAYSSNLNFKISYAPIDKHTFGENFNPLTPMIKIDNGGAYADEIMEVTIPVTVPADSFAMGFIYDEKTKTLQGLPTLAQTETSITVGTRHFTDFLISMIPLTKLKSDIDSGFRPGIDDWQFTNRGSYIAQGGHCAGQSVTALWYYVTQPDGKDLTLYERYDNNGIKPATPALWQDDSLGYRFASTVHHDINWSSFENKFWTSLAGVSDEWTWKLFAYSIQITGEPQEVGIYSNAGGGHDMICYRVKDGNLYIADPNYPGDTERRIEFKDGKFVPYNSGANAEEIANGNGKAYEKIEYCAKTTTVSWDLIAQRWAEFKAGTVGNGVFPNYKIVYKDADGKYPELKDGHVSPDKLIKIEVSSNTPNKAWAIYRDGVKLKQDADSKYELLPGTNKLGIYVVAMIDALDQNNNPIKVSKYIDFKYINVVFNVEATALSISPDSVTLEPGQTQVLTLTSSKPPVKASYEWLMGSLNQNINTSVKTGTDKTYTYNATELGTYVISVKEWDEGASPRKLTGGTAACIIDVKAKSVSKLELLQGMSAVKIDLISKHTYNVWQAPSYTGTRVLETISIPDRSTDIHYMPISWSGTNFSSTLTLPPEDVYTINGSVSADGLNLTNLTFSRITNSGGTYQYSDQNMQISLTGVIPIWPPGGPPSNTVKTADITGFTSTIAYEYNNYYTGGVKRDHEDYASTDWSNGRISIQFLPEFEPWIIGSNGNFHPK